jgi:hypothetical protein
VPSIRERIAGLGLLLRERGDVLGEALNLSMEDAVRRELRRTAEFRAVAVGDFVDVARRPNRLKPGSSELACLGIDSKTADSTGAGDEPKFWGGAPSALGHGQRVAMLVPRSVRVASRLPSS